MTALYDSFQRPINYLRVSVTDRCNLRCFYCLPNRQVKVFPRKEILSWEEIEVVVRACVGLGIDRIRLTGGEPLVRKGIVDFVSRLSKIEGIEDLSVTTNGILLASCAEELKQAGLKRVNVSLDSLKRDRFARITGRDSLFHVLEGVEEAKRAGLDPVKINMVVMRGVNDDEVVDFARKSIEDGWHVRFIELMPFGNSSPQMFIPIVEVKGKLERHFGQLEPASSKGSGPAKYYRFPGASGTIGFITPISKHFCFSCNRLRLTASGKLKLCLIEDVEVDLKMPLRNGANIEEIARLIKEATKLKPYQHRLNSWEVVSSKSMREIGG